MNENNEKLEITLLKEKIAELEKEKSELKEYHSICINNWNKLNEENEKLRKVSIISQFNQNDDLIPVLNKYNILRWITKEEFEKR